jgi:hypothetical protein
MLLKGLAILSREISTGASHDSAERYPPPRCHRKTRNAIIKEILAWTKTEDTSKVLWLHGPAGAGKSAIAQTIAEHLERDRHLAASFFFSRYKPGRSDARLLFSTIAYQIAISVPGMREVVDRTVESDRTLLSRSMDVQFQKLVVEPFEAVGTIPTQASPMVVIIDGLDECEGRQVPRAISSLISNALQLPLRFLIASRPEPYIQDASNRPRLKQITTLLAINTSDFADNDIRTYLRSRFATIHRSHRDIMQLVPKPWPSQDVIEHLVKKASGMFIYASTVLKFVDDGYPSPPDRLAMVLEFVGSGRNAFAELDMLYKQILSTHLDTSRLLSILGPMITIAIEPALPPAQMEDFLGLKYGTIRMELRGLHSLFRIPDHHQYATSVIRHHHASFSDFLQDHTRSGKFYIDAPLHHAAITRSCLRIITEWSGYRSAAGSRSLYCCLYVIKVLRMTSKC